MGIKEDLAKQERRIKQLQKLFNEEEAMKTVALESLKRKYNLSEVGAGKRLKEIAKTIKETEDKLELKMFELQELLDIIEGRI